MNFTITFLIIIVISLIILIILQYKSISNTNTYKKTKTWGNFHTSAYPTLIIIGDYYVYMDTLVNGKQGLIRDLSINSDEELDEMLSIFPEKANNIKKTHHTFMTKLAPWGISKIIPVILSKSSVYNLKLSSTLQWQDLKAFNIIYIGSYKSLSILSPFFENSSFDYNIDEDLLILQTEGNDTKEYKTTRNIKPGLMKDYAVVLKTQASNKNSVLMFLSTHDIGDIATINYFTHHETLKRFEEKYLSQKGSTEFEALFEVSGFEKTDFELKPLYVKAIK